MPHSVGRESFGLFSASPMVAIVAHRGDYCLTALVSVTKIEGQTHGVDILASNESSSYLDDVVVDFFNIVAEFHSCLRSR